MARHKDTSWNLPEGTPSETGNTHSWDSIHSALLMDIRDELKSLNRVLACPNFFDPPHAQNHLEKHRQETATKEIMTRLLFLFCALRFSCGHSFAADFDVEHMADVLPLKEVGGHWNGQPGPGGELSAWQLTEPTWRQHMAPLPFSQARDPALARLCAVRHLNWLVEQIQARGLAVTPQRVATCWHFGLGHAAERTQWGLEVANLYHDLP